MRSPSASSWRSCGGSGVVGSGSPGIPTKVPFVEPRSSTYQRSWSSVSSAWRVRHRAVARAVDLRRRCCGSSTPRPISASVPGQRDHRRRAARRARSRRLLRGEPVGIDPQLGDPLGAGRRCRRWRGGRELAGREVVAALLAEQRVGRVLLAAVRARPAAARSARPARRVEVQRRRRRRGRRGRSARGRGAAAAGVAPAIGSPHTSQKSSVLDVWPCGQVAVMASPVSSSSSWCRAPSRRAWTRRA